MLTYAFPGQGAQKKGMLTEDLIAGFPELLQMADKVLGYSLRELCLHDPERRLDQTAFTQPALFAVNALAYLHRMEKTGQAPDFAIGHSLGEYNALFAAGAFDFETGLRLVWKRGQLMSRVTGGAMAVVIGLPLRKITALLEENGLSGIDPANLNAPLQTTIAGLREEVERARPLFEKAGARFIALNVSGPFHSRHMQAAAEAYRTYLDGFRFNELRFPVISNVSATPHSPAQLKDSLVRHFTSPVRWVDSVRYLMRAGVDTFEEIGPGKTLTALIMQIRREGLPAHDVESSPAPEPGAAEDGPAIPAPALRTIAAESLGSREFKEDYGLKYAYLAGSMYKGISSEELVVRMGKAGLMGFFGAGGLGLERIEKAILAIRKELHNGEAFGMNLLCNVAQPEQELRTVDLFLRHGIDKVEASGYMQLTPAVVKYRLAGLRAGPGGGVVARNKLIAKLSRPEIASLFLAPAPEAIVNALLESRQIGAEEARLSRFVPLADDICVEADSAGHTDRRSAAAILPAILRLRDDMMHKHAYARRVRVGLAGGIGTPEAAAAAFIMGAEFIMTGSINQCTVEAGNSDAVKNLLEKMDAQDTDYAPAGDMFEIGSKIQVLKKGLFFSARANKLYELYRQHDSLDRIDRKTLDDIERKYFGRSIDEVYRETRDYWLRVRPSEVEKAERDPKGKMALIFKWYFVHTMRLALQGSEKQPFDYQVHCGPALGAFNRWVKETPLEGWRNRHVDEIAKKLMRETAETLNAGIARLVGNASNQ